MFLLFGIIPIFPPVPPMGECDVARTTGTLNPSVGLDSEAGFIQKIHDSDVD